MGEIIAVFTSRREAIEFGRSLAAMRVRAKAVSTPSALGSSCGLSVRFSRSVLGAAERALYYGEYFTFQGFYEV